MTILDRAENGSFVARLIGPEDGLHGWQVHEERNGKERVSIVSVNRSRLIEQWRVGKLKFFEWTSGGA